MCLIFTDDGRIVEREVPVLKGCAADDNLVSAWLIDANNQIQDEKSKNWYQVIGERSTIPVCLVTESKVKDLTKLINNIFHESWVTDLVTSGREAAKDKARQWMIIILGTPIILGTLILGISLIGK